jgi:hypothetical protein
MCLLAILPLTQWNFSTSTVLCVPSGLVNAPMASLVGAKIVKVPPLISPVRPFFSTASANAVSPDDRQVSIRFAARITCAPRTGLGADRPRTDLKLAHEATDWVKAKVDMVEVGVCGGVRAVGGRRPQRYPKSG